MYFKQEQAISILSGKPLKLVDKFTFIGSNISSTESDVNIRLRKLFTAIDILSIIRKSDLFDKIKRHFFYAVSVSVLLYRRITWTLMKRMSQRLDENFEWMLRTDLSKFREQYPTKGSYTATFLPSHQPSKLKEQNMRDTAGEIKTNLSLIDSYI